MTQDEMLTFFSNPLLADVIVKREWLDSLSQLVEEVENSHSHSPKCQKWVEALYKNKTPFQQALILHGLRELLSQLFASFEEPEVDDEWDFSPQNNFLVEHLQSKQDDDNVNQVVLIVPQIAYYISKDTRTIEIEVDGQLVALIKPGELRQQSDMFLYHFYQECKEKLNLPKQIPDLFLPSYPCSLKFSDLKTREKLACDAEFVVSARKNRAPSFWHIPLQSNISYAGSVFGGGIQEYLKTTEPQSAISRTILLFFVCALGCRDLKDDGIIGSIVVDCEDYLEEKKSWNKNVPFPKIHVPFTRSILLEVLDRPTLSELANYLEQLDLDALEEFILNVDYIEPKHTPEYYKNKKDPREGYAVPSPNYADNRLQSHEQVGELINNLQKLKEILPELLQQPTCTTHQFLTAFDPAWSEARDIFVSLFLAGVEKNQMALALFGTNQQKAVEEFSRIFTDRDPEDLPGSFSSKPPTPVNELWKKRSSPALSLGRSTNGTPHPRNSPEFFRLSETSLSSSAGAFTPDPAGIDKDEIPAPSKTS